MVSGSQANHRGSHSTLADRARALAVVLREEFGVPVACYDVSTGRLVPGVDTAEQARSAELSPETVARLAGEGGARVTLLPDRRFRLALIVAEGGRPILVAVGVLNALTPEVRDTEQEEKRLEKWLRAVGDRLRLTDQLQARRRLEEEQAAQITQVWEGLLAVDHVVRRLRIHKEPEKNRQRILEAAFDLLSVQALAWVPQDSQAAVHVCGETGLAPSDLRQLVGLLVRKQDLTSAKPLLCNQDDAALWSARFPQVHNLILFTACPQLGRASGDPPQAGWVLALNKWEQRRRGAEENGASVCSAAAPFRRTDAAFLTPFVALLEMHTRTSRRYQDLKDLLVGLTRSLTSALDAKDAYTFGHSERVARIAVELGRELGLQEEDLSDIYLTGLLHDVGKIGVRDDILSKPDPLTVEELEHLKQHVMIGYRILADLKPIRNLLPGVLYHHERYDGKGYPDGLAGEEIPLLARVLAVADAYDAMSTCRPYRDSLSLAEVEKRLTEGAGTHWDP
ncbi:MAG TPA: HD-GYP domain-containing protein, partial [Gemmataceae bacterium]|nr:HD-GYP domain-containing protein [Gemmataceae bacterium]